MKLNRRGFFGLSAGAAIAGPSAAKSVATTIAKESGYGLMAESPATNYALNSTLDSKAPRDWLQSELKDLFRQLKRVKGSDRKISDYQSNTISGHRIDSLVSVSSVNKARMIAEAMERKAREKEIGYIEQRIEELKEQLGPLGMIFDD